jgi:hypothetical protein
MTSRTHDPARRERRFHANAAPNLGPGSDGHPGEAQIEGPAIQVENAEAEERAAPRGTAHPQPPEFTFDHAWGHGEPGAPPDRIREKRCRLGTCPDLGCLIHEERSGPDPSGGVSGAQPSHARSHHQNLGFLERRAQHLRRYLCFTTALEEFQVRVPAAGRAACGLRRDGLSI